MSLPVTAVLVFDQEEDLVVFPTAQSAADWLEAMDVADGEYPAAFTVDGRVVALSAPEGRDGPAAAAVTDRQDLTGLERWTARYWRSHRADQDPLGPAATAALLFAEQSEPRRGPWAFLLAAFRRGRTQTATDGREDAGTDGREDAGR